MKTLTLRTWSGFLLVTLVGVSALGGTPEAIVINSAAQSLTVGACSGPVLVKAVDSSGAAANMPSNTKIFFTGSDRGLSFFSDPNCATAVSTVLMNRGTGSKSFFFKGSAPGKLKLIVATYNYVDGSQIETTGGSINPPPAPAPVPAPVPVPPVVLPPTSVPPPPTIPSSGGIRGRAVPSPIYGVTLDDITNLSGISSSLKSVVRTPTARVVFDSANAATYYKSAVQQIGASAYVMGQILDSTDMATISVAAYQQRTQSYVNTLGNTIDIWEIGNEINGNWVGANTALTGDKVRAAFDVVQASNGATALTFFWEGNPGDANNCVDGPGFDMFGWINNFLANPANDRVRLGLDYVFISWYPQQCNNIKPDWVKIFTQVSQIFPNAKVGFGEIGTANPQSGSAYEVNLINEFYPMAAKQPLPSNYVGGYFWWYFYEEMIPSTKTPLMNVLNSAILAGPQSK